MKTICLILLASALVAIAGSLTVAWDYDFVASPDVTAFRIYAVPGTNVLWQPGNVNPGTKMANVMTGPMIGLVTNIQGVLTGLPVGYWTVTVTALSTNGVESENANSVTAPVRPGKPITVRIP